MLALESTSVVVQAFESRFTRLGEQNFLLSKDGSEAFPVSAAERENFIQRYSRAMKRARVLRWLGWLSFLPLIALTAALGELELWSETSIEDLPGWDAFAFTLIFGAPAAGIFQHMITSDVMNARFMREVGNRFPTRLPSALQPGLSRTAKIGFILLCAGGAIDIGFRLYFGFAPRTDFHGAHMRALYGYPGGNDPWYAQVTAGVLKLAHLAALAGGVLLWIARRADKRSSARAKEAEAAKPLATRQRT